MWSTHYGTSDGLGHVSLGVRVAQVMTGSFWQFLIWYWVPCRGVMRA
jgi:hypothetical protein